MEYSATEAIYRLVDFAQAKKLVNALDRSYAINRLLDVMRMDEPENIDYTPEAIPETAAKYLNILCDAAAQTGILTDSGENRDLFSTRLMGELTPHPAMVRERFFALYDGEGAKAAMDDFYAMCRNSDYIKVDRIAQNARFFEDTSVGRLEITINLSKPEKDPRDIAAIKNQKQTDYPKCMLCPENPGYAGRIGFPARQNHRVISLTLGGKPWYLQYSPYLYYNEHCIVFNQEHIPMRVSHDTFVRLFDFVEQFPHYFLGSNADLPIVGGSILNHDHFQGGNYRFPMDDAKVRIPLIAPEENVDACVVDWPLSCIRLRSDDRNALTRLGDAMLNAWRVYSDPECDILARTDAPHNTITPIVRMENGMWKLDLVLRNNRATQEHPFGIFHPHMDLHHIKKENIGLIEVMGLFILPGRLRAELRQLEGYLTGEIAPDVKPSSNELERHYAWILDILSRTQHPMSHEQAQTVLRHEVGIKCARVLSDAGVYKNDDKGNAGILRFLASIGYKMA